MENPVEFNAKVSPVCLPAINSQEQYIGKEVTVIGWGARQEGKIHYSGHDKVEFGQLSILNRWDAFECAPASDGQSRAEYSMQKELRGLCARRVHRRSHGLPIT